MNARQILFRDINHVELADIDFDETDLGPLGLVLRTHYTVVSAGTEIAKLTGVESSMAFPGSPGYGAVGEVIAVRDEAAGVRPGDRVFTYSRHQTVDRANLLTVRVPDGLAGERAVLARLASVAMTALRVSPPELGDWAAVFGMGAIGNFAAQLLQLAGCEVIGIDLSEPRLERARACGVAHTVNAGQADVGEAIGDLTGGRMCDRVVEASGNPRAALDAVGVAGRLGEVVLVGSPRVELPADVTPLLRQVHLWQHGCVTLKGGHEWRYPTRHDPGGWAKHSIERNIEIILRLMAEGRLRTEEVLTHVAPAAECAQLYAGLRDRPDEYLGVVFDWGRS
jgi:threonine dehydrogenase-like Zn-dependent dehydrogenase